MSPGRLAAISRHKLTITPCGRYWRADRLNEGVHPTVKGVVTPSKSLDDYGEAEECKEDNVEFVKAGEGTAESLEPPEEPFNLVASAIHGFVILPRFQAVAFRWDDRNEAEIERQWALAVTKECRNRIPSLKGLGNSY